MNAESKKYKNEVVLDLIKKYQVDALVINSVVNRFWYTGLMSTAGYLIITHSKASLLIDERYFANAKKSLKDINVIIYKSFADLVLFFKENKINKILLENEYVTLKDLIWIKKLVGNQYIGFDSVVMRKIKTSEELKLLQKSADIAVATFSWIKSKIKVGMTEIQVSGMITNHMVELGASGNSFSLIVAFGENTAQPHHQPTHRKLNSGEFIKLDIGCVYAGYCSDITRTFWLGQPSKQMLEIYEIVLKANLAGIDAATAGITGVELDAVCRDYINTTKYKNNFVHGTGHGLGIEIHELPNVKKEYLEKIEKNTVVTIEPGIYVNGIGGVRIEDSIVITDTKPVVLTAKASKIN